MRLRINIGEGELVLAKNSKDLLWVGLQDLVVPWHGILRVIMNDLLSFFVMNRFLCFLHHRKDTLFLLLLTWVSLFYLGGFFLVLWGEVLVLYRRHILVKIDGLLWRFIALIPWSGLWNLILLRSLRLLGGGSRTYDRYWQNIFGCRIDVASNQSVNCFLKGFVERFVLRHLLLKLCDGLLVRLNNLGLYLLPLYLMLREHAFHFWEIHLVLCFDLLLLHPYLDIDVVPDLFLFDCSLGHRGGDLA